MSFSAESGIKQPVWRSPCSKSLGELEDEAVQDESGVWGGSPQGAHTGPPHLEQTFPETHPTPDAPRGNWHSA
ncbi:hypothetical protein TNCT6_23770 [Streptomyces sp. 6-11-2]|nr:hypothetical protein TNCT6_23770 [Streptomyces sp. 6-11-2]